MGDPVNGTLSAVTIDPDVLGRKPCFSGTRVRIKTLFDALARGRSLAYFAGQFPSVRAKQVRDVLAAADRRVGAHASAAAA